MNQNFVFSRQEFKMVLGLFFSPRVLLLNPARLIKLSGQCTLDYIWLFLLPRQPWRKSTLVFYCNYSPDLEALPEYPFYHAFFTLLKYFKEKFSQEQTKYVCTSLKPLLYRTHWHPLTHKMKKKGLVPLGPKFTDTSKLFFMVYFYITSFLTTAFFLDYFMILVISPVCMSVQNIDLPQPPMQCPPFELPIFPPCCPLHPPRSNK